MKNNVNGGIKIKAKNLVICLVWANNEFIVVDKPPEEQISLIIDEEKETIIYYVPKSAGIVVRRTVDRRVKSIAKTGYMIPDKHIRIGAGFELTETGIMDEIPDILLQIGHSYAGPGQEKQEKEKPIIKTVEPEKKTRLVVPKKKIKEKKKKTEIKTSQIIPITDETTSMKLFNILDNMLLENEILLSKDTNNNIYKISSDQGEISLKISDQEIEFLSITSSSERNKDFEQKVEEIKNKLRK